MALDLTVDELNAQGVIKPYGTPDLAQCCNVTMTIEENPSTQPPHAFMTHASDKFPAYATEEMYQAALTKPEFAEPAARGAPEWVAWHTMLPCGHQITGAYFIRMCAERVGWHHPLVCPQCRAKVDLVARAWHFGIVTRGLAPT